MDFGRVYRGGYALRLGFVHEGGIYPRRTRRARKGWEGLNCDSFDCVIPPPTKSGQDQYAHHPLTRTTALTIIAQQFTVRSCSEVSRSSMKQPQRGRKGQEGAGLISRKCHRPQSWPRSVLALRGARGAKGQVFRKTFSPPQIADSPNLIQPNSTPGYLRPHARGNPGGGVHPHCFHLPWCRWQPAWPITMINTPQKVW